MDNFLDASRKIYDRLGDEISKKIYSSGVMFNLTSDERYLDGSLCELLRNSFEDEIKKFVKNEMVFIFGAGNFGRRVSKAFPELKICGFLDNNASSISMEGYPIFKPNQVNNVLSKSKIIIATKDSYDSIKNQLTKIGVDENNIFCLGKYMNKYERTFENNQYFDLASLKHTSDEIFVDVGVFDGETTKRFIEWTNGDYKRIYLFEANPDFNKRIIKNIQMEKECYLIEKGLWSENADITFWESPKDNEFNVDIDEHNCIDKDKLEKEKWIKHVIPVVKMDDAIPNEKVTFIKMDIEGSECDALKGAERIIRSFKPKIAISAYHKRDDLWTIPSLLLSYRFDYTFYLRHYGFEWGETVLYAI